MKPGSLASPPTVSTTFAAVVSAMLYAPVHVCAPSMYCVSVRVAPAYVCVHMCHFPSVSVAVCRKHAALLSVQAVLSAKGPLPPAALG